LAEHVPPVHPGEVFRDPSKPVEISFVRNDIPPFDVRHSLIFRLISNYVVAERDGDWTTAVLGKDDSVRCYLKDESYTDRVRFAYVDTRLVTEEIDALVKSRANLREILARHKKDRVEHLPDPIRRYVTYLAVIDEIKEDVIAIEDFTCNYQPLTKQVVERIARAEAQYLIETYDPQAVLSLAEKTRANDLNIYLVHRENGRTSAKKIDPEEVLELGFDLFFNLDRWGVEG
jgi:hypothetical protein